MLSDDKSDWSTFNLRRSFQRYVRDIARWGWYVLICVLFGDVVTIWLALTGNVPPWVPVVFTVISLLAVPFIAYHGMRIELQDKYLKRVRQLKDKAGKSTLLGTGTRAELAQARERIHTLAVKMDRCSLMWDDTTEADQDLKMQVVEWVSAVNAGLGEDLQIGVLLVTQATTKRQLREALHECVTDLDSLQDSLRAS